MIDVESRHHWRQPRREHIPQYFGWRDVNENIPQYYYILQVQHLRIHLHQNMPFLLKKEQKSFRGGGTAPSTDPFPGGKRNTSSPHLTPSALRPPPPLTLNSHWRHCTTWWRLAGARAWSLVTWYGQSPASSRCLWNFTRWPGPGLNPIRSYSAGAVSVYSMYLWNTF